jgi:hypothetical protein
MRRLVTNPGDEQEIVIRTNRDQYNEGQSRNAPLPGCSVNSEKTQFDTQAPSLANLRRKLPLDRGLGPQRPARTRHLCPVSQPRHQALRALGNRLVGPPHGCLQPGIAHGQGLTTPIPKPTNPPASPRKIALNLV